MTDYFALFGEVRRPWLDPEALKQKFLARSGQVHPDRVHQQGESERRIAQSAYLDLNAGYQCLREPRERVRHLLELELGGTPGADQQIPPGVVDLFLEIGPACQKADKLLSEKAAVTSPLLQVQCFVRSRECRDQLEELRQKLDGRTDQLIVELKEIDAEWTSSSPSDSPRSGLFNRLEENCRQLGYFDRWRKQLQERMLQLNF